MSLNLQFTWVGVEPVAPPAIGGRLIFCFSESTCYDPFVPGIVRVTFGEDSTTYMSGEMNLPYEVPAGTKVWITFGETYPDIVGTYYTPPAYTYSAVEITFGEGAAIWPPVQVTYEFVVAPPSPAEVEVFGIVIEGEAHTNLLQPGGTNRVSLRFIEEDEFGVVPRGVPTGIRLTGEALGANYERVLTKEIVPDRQVHQSILARQSTDGPVEFEMSYRAHDDLIAAALADGWDDYASGSVTLSLDSTAGTLTASAAPSGAAALTNLSVGRWLQLRAPSDPADGQYLQVVSATSDTLTVSALAGAGTRSVPACTLAGGRVHGGVTPKTFSVERVSHDLDMYTAFRGLSVGSMELLFRVGDPITGLFEFVGRDQEIHDFTVFYEDELIEFSGKPMNSAHGLSNLLEGGQPLTDTFIKEMTLKVDNGVRANYAMWQTKPIAIVHGASRVEGKIRAYLSGPELYTKALNNVRSSLSWTVRDNNGDGYVFTLPRVQYRVPPISATGANIDIMLEMSFVALADPVTGQSVIIDRLGS